MINGIFKEFGLRILIIFGIVLLFFLWISRIKKTSKNDGKIEQMIQNWSDREATLKKARKAKKEFGTSIEDLEYDDFVQYKNKNIFFYDGDKMPQNVTPVADDPYILQFKNSPFKRDR